MLYRIDPGLLEWPENDFRIFVGDLGNETNDEVLTKAFQKYPTFNKAKVVRDKKSNKTKGETIISTRFQQAFRALMQLTFAFLNNPNSHQ